MGTSVGDVEGMVDTVGPMVGAVVGTVVVEGPME